MSSVVLASAMPSGIQLIAAIASTDPSAVASAAINSQPQTRTVGQQLLIAQTASQVRRILPRPPSSAESLALFHFGT